MVIPKDYQIYFKTINSVKNIENYDFRNRHFYLRQNSKLVY